MQYITGSMIAMVVGGFLTATFGLLASLSKQKRTPPWICWTTFVAGVVVIGAGVWAGIDDAKDNARILALTEENAALATGGDSYGYLCVGGNAKSNVVEATFIHCGKHPLYNCKVKIVDITKLKNLPRLLGPHNQADLEFSIIRSIGNVAPTQSLDGPSIELPVQGPVQQFRCEFFANNGRWEQDIIIHHVPEVTASWSDGSNSVPLPERSFWTPGWRVMRGPDVLQEHNTALFQKSDHSNTE
jgi:hypothetical protein